MYAASRDKGVRKSCEDQHSFDLPQSMDSDNRARNHNFLSLTLRKLM